MRGSVVKRGKSYAVVIELSRDPETGKRRQRWHSGYRTKKEAERARTELLSTVYAGTYVAASRQTLAEFIEEWLPAIAPTVRESTHYSYERNLRLHVVPYVGAITLQDIDGGALNGLYAKLLKEGSHHQRGGGLSKRTVRYVHTILHRVFKDANKWGRLARNPADAADPPKIRNSERSKIVTWSGSELAEFLQSVSDHRLAAAFTLLATTGMRRGEALGLRWSDLGSLEDGSAAIRQTVICVNHRVQFGTPKTDQGKRSVAIDKRTMAALKAHRQRQIEERLLMGAYWQDNDLVFTSPTGAPLHPERFSRTFDKRVARSELPRIRLHDLRHTWATLALEAGVHPKIVQERLGHANVGITLDIYSHSKPTLQRDAAEMIAERVFGGERKGK